VCDIADPIEIFKSTGDPLNIIIPLGGLGERFKNDGYILPKPLINIFGKPMIFYVIDNLCLTNKDKLIFIYNKDLNKYGFNNIIKNKYNNVQLIELNKQTEGSAETILIGLENIDKSLIQNKCVLLDCDTFYKLENIDILEKYRTQEDNAIFCFNDNQEKPIFSYVKINEKNGFITEIKEKVKISNYANTGCYCFNNGHILKKYCEQVIKKNIREKNEYYTSCVIKEMIEDGHKFVANIIDINNFVCVGTPLQLKIFCSNFETNFIKKRICFELDDTLVYLIDKKNYNSVSPIYRNIDYLKFLHNLGHTIIIYTSRGMKKYKNNEGLAIKNIAQITFETLEKYNIPYDEIYFGKPDADFYIDNLNINGCDDLEKTIGFYKTHIQERYFNNILTKKMDIITKKSNDKKLLGEIYYYKNIPKELKQYFPLFIDNGENWYSIEKIKGITMSYLYVNESLSEEVFVKYLNIFKNIHMCQKNKNSLDSKLELDINIYDNYSKKIEIRYTTNYDLYSKYKNSKEIYDDLLQYFNNYEKNNNGIKGIIHGDAVMSNCIIDENNNFKLIDMRGKIYNTCTIYGDIFYDYAKIYQSLIGYDEILLDKIISNEYRQKMINIFFKYILENYDEKYIDIIKNITNSLLFTLLPLHNDRKCDDFYKLIKL
jgi:capsule biosynthesis phosphatase